MISPGAGAGLICPACCHETKELSGTYRLAYRLGDARTFSIGSSGASARAAGRGYCLGLFDTCPCNAKVPRVAQT